MITIYDIKLQHFTAKYIANLIINDLINKVVQCNGKDKTKKLSSFTPIAVPSRKYIYGFILFLEKSLVFRD